MSRQTYGVTKEDIRQLGIDRDSDNRVAAAMDRYVAENHLTGNDRYAQALEAIAESVGVQIGKVAPAAFVAGIQDEEEDE